MRVVFYGMTDITKQTADKFIGEGHDVIIIDKDKEVIDKMSSTMDCSFLVGDASHPQVLTEVNPKETDFFIALSTNSQDNIVACLIARSLGIERVMLQVNDPDYEEICTELDLNEMIIPAQITSQYLFDGIFHENMLEMFQIMKDKMSLYKIIIDEEDEGSSNDLDLDVKSRIICYFREDQFYHYDEPIQVRKGDQLILVTDQENFKRLAEKRNHQRDDTI